MGLHDLATRMAERGLTFDDWAGAHEHLEHIGYYCVNGMAIMAAQGRSLGFSLVFATQDIPAMMRENDKEAKSIIANTSFKMFLRVEELEQTAKIAIDSAGEGLKAQLQGWSGTSGELATTYHDSMEARVEKVNRLSALDLRALGVGEAYVTWHDQLFKVKTFHAFPEGEYGKDLSKLELRVNHFIAVARPNPTDVKREETLPKITEKLCDLKFAQIVEQRAKAERAAIEQAAAHKRDPAKMKSEIACAAVAMLRANKKRGPGGDYLTASCAALAAITLAQINDAHVFTREVRQIEGLAPHSGGLAATARSGQSRVPSEVPGLVSPAARAAARGGRAEGAMGRPGRPLSRTMPPPAFDDEPPPPDDLEFETEPDDEDAHAFTDAFGRPDTRPTDPARIEAQRSEAPSTMRKVEHGVTVDGHDTFKMAEKLQTNDATLRFLAALNFDADEGSEPGVEVVDTAIEKAVIFDDEEDAPPQPTPAADPAAIERADVASARATQWTERATRPAAHDSRAPVPDLETAVKSGNVEDMTASFLADLLEE
ncbi:MAG: hypothetical protein NTAFB05_19990 [Nitrobacter sp.]|uniref:hypothetical protein n=1 Tax=Nitrobacter sp. TaxID=29420 RepID=UPI00387DE33E